MKEGPSFRRITTQRRPHADNRAAYPIPPRRQRGLRGLKPGSRRPRNSRKPQRDPALVKAVLALRKKPPCYGKDKTAVELRKRGWGVSASMAGAFSPTRRGAESSASPRDPASAAATPSPSAPTPSASPKTTGLPAQATSSKSTRSTFARSPEWSSSISRRGTSSPAATSCRWGRKRPPRARREFLDAIVARMPFPVRAIQVDGGSEFQGAFEEACRERGVLLFGAAAAFAEVEGYAGTGRMSRSSTTSTMGVGDGAIEPCAAGMGGAFLYENRRQSLGWRTPMEYLAERRLEEAS